MCIIDKRTNKPLFIDKNTIAIIRLALSGKYVLTLYDNEKEIFEKEYNSFTGAKIAQSHYLKKLYYL